MKALLKGLRAWWLRRFYGIVEPPAQYGGQGTTWRQHPRSLELFSCTCGQLIRFTEADLVIRSRDHHSDHCNDPENCARCVACFDGPCSCPVTDARYVKICPHCHLGHWKVATP